MKMRLKFMDIYDSTTAKSIRLTCAKVPLAERVLKWNPQGTMLSWTKYEWKSPIPVKDRRSYLCDFNEENLRDREVSCYFTSPLIVESAGAYR